MRVRARITIHEVTERGDSAHEDLVPGQVYEVIGMDDEHYRVIDKAGEPILYPKPLFEELDSSIPPAWVRRDYPDGEYHLYPPELSERGFFDRYFDGKPKEVAIFQKYLEDNRIEHRRPCPGRRPPGGPAGSA